jgi:hypothetical protein
MVDCWQKGIPPHTVADMTLPQLMMFSGQHPLMKKKLVRKLTPEQAHKLWLAQQSTEQGIHKA